MAARLFREDGTAFTWSAQHFPRRARLLFESLSAGYTGLSAVTDYPLSVKHLVPFKAHGATELAIAAILPVLPFALGFADHRAARNLCFGLTALTLVVAALTDWNGVKRGDAAMRG